MKQVGRTLLVGSGVTLTLLHAPVVIAAEYASIETVQRSAFATADRFDEISVMPTAEQQAAIAALAGPQAPHGKLRVWRASSKGQPLGYVFSHEVVGRQDLISYALSINVDGVLGDVEILAYRESHGAEIKNRAWRKQFAGKRNLATLRFATDIKNIAGATLSCEHVTQGVRWLVALWQITLSGPAL